MYIMGILVVVEDGGQPALYAAGSSWLLQMWTCFLWPLQPRIALTRHGPRCPASDAGGIFSSLTMGMNYSVLHNCNRRRFQLESDDFLGSPARDAYTWIRLMYLSWTIDMSATTLVRDRMCRCSRLVPWQ